MAKNGKGLLSGNNLLWFGILAVGGYLAWTKVIQPGMGDNGRNVKSPPMLDEFGRPPNKLRGPPSGLNPYSGVSNDGAPTVYQDDWTYGRL